MKSFNTIFILILSMMIVSSCGQKKEGETSGLVVIGGGIAGTQLGGVKLYGKNSFGVVFSKSMTSDQPLQIELPNGNWDFAAIGWTGASGPMTGEVRCGTTDNVQLNGGEITVALSISKSGCAENLFGESYSKSEESQPNPLTFKTCTENKAKNDPGVCSRGFLKSYRVVLPDFALAPGANFNPTVGLVSGCEDDPLTTFASPETDSTIRVPVFGPQAEVPIPTVIVGYENTGCTGDEQSYVFMQGIAGETYNAGVTYDPGKVILNLINDEYCSGARLGDAPFASGASNADMNYICNATQMNAIEASGVMTDNYMLMDYIDFISVTPNPIGVAAIFNGKFYGNDREIENWTFTTSAQTEMGIFTRIGNGAVIEDLYVSNSDLTCTDCSNVGLLVGDANAGGGNADIKNVLVKDSLLTVTCSSPATFSAFGGVVGNMVGGAKLEESTALRLDIDAGNDCDSVGIAVGFLDGSATGVKLNSFYGLDNYIDAQGAGSDVGGLVGFVTGASAELVNSANENIIIDIDTKTAIGGIVGSQTANAIISRNIATGVITLNGSATKVGGIIGDSNANSSINITNLLADVDIDYTAGAPGELGGIAGSTANTTAVLFDYVVSIGDITGAYDVGGAFGIVDVNTTISHAGAYGNVTINSTGGNEAGGLIGKCSSPSVNKSFAIGDVIVPLGVNSVTHVGGLIGLKNAGAIADSYALGDVLAQGDTGSAGAIAGQLDGAGTTADRVYFYGGVTAGGGNVDDGFGSVTAGAAVTDCSQPTGMGDANCDAASDLTAQGNYTNFLFGGANPWIMSAADGVNFAQLQWYKKWEDVGGFTTGSPLNPIEIYTATQLNSLGDEIEFMKSSISIQNNIDISGVPNFNSIGSPTNKYMGQFFGNGHTINGLNINDGATDSGFFGALGSDSINGGAKINPRHKRHAGQQSLHFTNVNISSSGDRTGTLAGAVSDTGGSQFEAVEINSIYVHNGVVNGNDTLGGIVGSFYCVNPGSRFSRAMNSATVTGAGGAVGEIGGIIGKLETGNLTDIETVVNYGSITNTGATGSIGGIVGYARGSAVINEAANFGDIYGATGVGAIVGVSEINLDKVFTNGVTITATSTDAGGIVGSFSGTSIDTAYVTNVSIDTPTNGGGLIGNGTSGSCNECFSDTITILNTGNDLRGAGSSTFTSSFSASGTLGTTARSSALLRSPASMTGLTGSASKHWTHEAGSVPQIFIEDFLLGDWNRFPK